MDFFLIILLLLIGYYWSDSTKTRETALDFVKNHCKKIDVQMLDEYVALNGLWLKRDKKGKIRLWRSYQFEFTSTGNERYNGKVIMLGRTITSIHLDPYKIYD
ncbi:MAG: DUF3301 domain-containing protein [Methylococcaceae bacterium]|nr:DUF3301 domain-containing protein [Methylococcaceae bacterium]